MRMPLACFFLFMVSSVIAQEEPALTKLQTIYATQVAWADAGELSYDEEAKVINMKNFRIPVSENTHLKFDKKVGNKVIFQCKRTRPSRTLQTLPSEELILKFHLKQRMERFLSSPTLID